MKRKILNYFFVTLFLILISCFTVYSQNYYHGNKCRVIVFELNDKIDLAALKNIETLFTYAQIQNVDIILLDINANGGLTKTSDSISNLILQSKIPVYAFINDQAVSAGATIALSCKRLYMKPYAQIGGDFMIDRNKRNLSIKFQLYQDYLSTAKNSKFQKQNLASAKPILLSASEAYANHLSEGCANNIPQVLELAGINNYKIIRQHISLFNQIIGFLTNPVVCGILIIIIVGGLYFEMESPEFGFPLFASIISASIYFTSLYIEGSASYWEIFVFIGGIILLSLEVFANPGFGISGIAGIILIGLGFFLCLLNNHFYDFSKTSHYLIFQSLTVVICSMIFSVIGSFYLSKKIHTYPNLLKYFSFKIIQKRNNSSSKEPLNLLIGKSGIAYTKLYPTGKIIIGKEIYEATSEVPVIEKNEKILVTKIETSQLYVKKL